MKTFTQWKCRSKIQYRTKKAAWRAALYFFKMLGTFSTVYTCKHCNKFHLTAKASQPSVPPEFIIELEKWFGMPLPTDE